MPYNEIPYNQTLRKGIGKKMKKVVVVFGTRPEAIKMCPVVSELKSRAGFDVVVCVTGQHREMLDQVLDVFAVTPDYDLTIMKDRQTLFDITGRVLDSLRPILEKEAPDVVLVHGDTTTTFAAALAAFYLAIPVGHVEAGLRTYNIRSPYPEEFNRQATDAVTSFFFAPTEWAAENLRKENKPLESIIVTGNTVIDALATTVKADYSHPVLDWAQGSRLVLLTAHRRENLGASMHQMLSAIKEVVDQHEDVKAVYPIHHNPQVKEVAEDVFLGCSRVRLIEPLDVVDFHNFMARSYVILTDSGGIQEEAPSLGKPVLVMRDTTERPEGISAGTLKLVGTEKHTVASAFTELLDNASEYQRMSETNNPYGDGKASCRIADFLENL
jgi:UDP-N-acetylglucosamine 2-epimerase (non-hydrolysing)